ncbi:hypothetical protein [Geofilum rhodophaeum]|uniref:hypothetical protein n=1 Tax=Geofilum rhodophaeum TaxID=1965019 RepID=UPI000B51EF44|nr:hypothetical protein [Geofilum rhodophaeum]
MEHLIHLVMGLLLLLSVLRHSFSHFVTNLVIATLSALSLIAMQPVLLNLPKSQVNALLQGYEAMTNMALLVSVELILFMAWCFSAFKKIRYAKFLKTFPGFMIFPVMWYLQAQSFYYFAGVKFELLTYGMALMAFVVMALAPRMVKWMIPEHELRRELIFITALLTLFLAAIAPAQDSPLFRHPQTTDWHSLLAFLIMALVLGSIGFLLKKRNIKWKQ